MKTTMQHLAVSLKRVANSIRLGLPHVKLLSSLPRTRSAHCLTWVVCTHVLYCMFSEMWTCHALDAYFAFVVIDSHEAFLERRRVGQRLKVYATAAYAMNN